MFQEDTYKIISKHAKKALDICQENNKIGQTIIWDYWGGDNQLFIFQRDGDDVFIKNKKSNKYLTVAGNQTQNGVPIIEQAYKGLKGQRFRIKKISLQSNEFLISTFCGKVLDCCQSSTKNGTDVIQWQYNKGENQKWIIEMLQKNQGGGCWF